MLLFDALGHALVAFCDSQLWPLLFSLYICGSLATFLLAGRCSSLSSAIVGAVGLSGWMNRGVFWSVLTGNAWPGNDGGPALWAIGIPAALVLTGLSLAFLAFSRETQETLPPPTASSAGQSIFAAQLQWLGDVEQELPAAANTVFAAIRRHVGALHDLGAELTTDSPVRAQAVKIVSEELRALFLRFKRVVVARRFIPRLAAAGEDELLAGLVRIEAALVEQRALLADSALRELQIETRYLELKHGEDVA